MDKINPKIFGGGTLHGHYHGRHCRCQSSDETQLTDLFSRAGHCQRQPTCAPCSDANHAQLNIGGGACPPCPIGIDAPGCKWAFSVNNYNSFTVRFRTAASVVDYNGKFRSVEESLRAWERTRLQFLPLKPIRSAQPHSYSLHRAMMSVRMASCGKKSWNDS